jgi:PAS domain S-box-containing protein
MNIKRPHLLLINANIEDRQQLRQLLDPMDLQISEVASGQDAVDILQSAVVDLVVTDIDIGPFDGWRLTRIIRSGIYQSGKSIPIIVVTKIWCERITEITARDFGVNQLLSFESCEKLPELVTICLESPSTGLQSPRLLVIEDHHENAQLVKKILQNRFDVELAADGESGLASWEEKRHDLILLDFMLPNMSGSAVLKKIINLNPAQPVVIMTAHATIELAHHLMLNGAADFVTKPFRAEELRKVCELAARRDDYMVSNAQFAARLDSLQQLRNLLGNIVDSMPSVLIGIDQDVRVTLWNRCAENISGISENNANGKLLTEVWPDCCELDEIHASLQGGTVKKKTNVLCRRNGQSHYCNITIYPLFSFKVIGAVIRIDDVTEQLLLEERIVQSEKLVSLGQLSAGLAHELNNPLAAIIQNIQVVKNRLSSVVNANQRTAEALGLDLSLLVEYVRRRDIDTQLDVILESGGRVAKLIENMLSFTRQEGSKSNPHNLSDLLDKAIDLAAGHYSLGRKFDFRQIEIKREYSQSLPLVKCDAAQIQQVFYNLLMNGANVMEEKLKSVNNLTDQLNYQPRFVVGLQDKDDFVRVEIEDNGLGMDETTQKHLFDPFFTTKQSGSGLGLSVCYFIVSENHHGKIGAESQLGAGTKFYIELPKT